MSGLVSPLMSPARQRAALELLELSESIRESCELGAWKDALEQQRNRRVLLDDFFASPCAESEASSVAAMIESLLETDNLVSALLYKHRGEILASAQNERRAAGNVNHYLENAS